MSKKETDISQISKYLNGELDAKAMHQLEKRALDDPFLMEALEGYETNGHNQQVQINEIGNRLQQRVAKPEKRMLPWKTLSIAASVLIVLSAGGIFLFSNHTLNKNTLAENIAPVPKISPVVTANKVNGKRAGVKKEIALQPIKPVEIKIRKNNNGILQADEKVLENPKANADISANILNKDTVAAVADSTPLNEMIVMDLTSQKKKALKEAAIKQDGQASKVVSSGNAVTEQLLQGKVDGVTTTNSPTPLQSSMSYLNFPIKKELIKGRVIGKDDGLPVAGATVKVAGTNIGTVTGTDGKFILHADSTKSKLVIAFIGYQTRELNLRDRDSLKTIMLQPTGSSLNEVVVTGYNTNKTENADIITTGAHPGIGWNRFRKYLKERAISTDGKTGIVKLSFEVDYSGKISNFKIRVGLTPPDDQKAIELVENGPSWIGNSTGKPETIKLTIKF